MKKRILSILLTLCMVLMLCPLTAFAEETHTATFKFDHGTLQLGDVTVTDSPYALPFTEEDGFTLGSITDCEPYTFLGWKCIDPDTGEDVGDYESGTWIETYTDITFEAVYQGPPTLATLAITVGGFRVGNAPVDCTYSFESTIPGVTFSEDDIQSVMWEECIFDGDGDVSDRSAISETEAFEADTVYRLRVYLDNKGLDMAPAVTVNGKTPEDCLIATRNGVPIQLQIFCTLGTPAEPTPVITINGPDVVCAQQDYEFTVTPPEGVTIEGAFGLEYGDDYDALPLILSADGSRKGVVETSYYTADSFRLAVVGATADGMSVSAAKTVQISPEHIYVDGVCGCGAVQQYTVEYIGSGDDPICMDTKTHGEPLTLRGETFTMDGFVQTGWVDGQGAKYDLGGAYTEDRDITLYPVFEKIVTVTVPFTTTVALGDAGEPGETTFELALIDGRGAALTADNVTAAAAVTTDGAGDYSAAMTITGPEQTLWRLLSEGAFVQQVNAGEDGWTVDDTVWGVLMEEIPVAYAMGDDATASGYTVYAVPASIDGNGYYYIDWENLQAADMTFTNTYTAHVYELKHDATHHWDECQCKDVQNKELHKYGDWKVTKEATETAKGEKEHTCTICGYTEKAEIAKLPATDTTDTTKNNQNTGAATSPNTGDNSHMALWIALLFVSGAGVIGTTVYGRKKRAK